MKARILIAAVFVAAVAAVAVPHLPVAAQQAAPAAPAAAGPEMPSFKYDPTWPKPLSNFFPEDKGWTEGLSASGSASTPVSSATRRKI